MKYSNDIENFKTDPTLYRKCNWYYNIILSIVLCFKHNSQTLCRHRKINILQAPKKSLVTTYIFCDAGPFFKLLFLGHFFGSFISMIRMICVP